MRSGQVLSALLLWLGAAAANATAPEHGSGLPFARAEHGSYASPEIRTGPAPQLDRHATTVAAGGSGGAFVIDVAFDTTITNDANAAAIEAMIYDAVAVLESVLDDPIVASIRFRYSTTYADDTTPLPANLLAASETGIYKIAWGTFIAALTGGATSPNDATANDSLPPGALATDVYPSSANGRAVGLGTAPVMFADGSLGVGAPYDGIVTINSSVGFTFTRPPASGTYDAQRSVEHEIDEVLGLGSGIGKPAGFRPQDLFSWSAPGVRSTTSSGSRYFSIDGGATNIVGFNQDPSGDFGDWLSEPCPQAHPYAQNAFSCADQTSDVTQTSPEGINLDVVGYDLAAITTTTTPTSTTSPTTTTTLPCPSGQIECCPVGQPGCGVCGIDCGNGGCCPASTPVCDNVNGLCLVPACEPPQVECCPVGQPGCGVCGTDCGNGGCCPASTPVCDNANGLCLAQGPQCAEGQVPCTDAAVGFSDVACCSQPAKGKQCAAACGQIVAACKASCATASRAKKCRKRCRSAIVGHCRRSRPHACS